MSNPLYALADQKLLPENQYLDEETVRWIEQNGVHSERSRHLDLVLQDYLAESYRVLRGYIPLEATVFARGTAALNSLHGELHAYRVALFSGVLARLYTNDELGPYVLAGLYHDIARDNDKADHGHGVRSSVRAVDLNLLGEDLTASHIVEAIARHEDSNVSTHDHPYTYILQAADALDRFRLPKLTWWPDTQRMPIAPSLELLSLAYRLVLATEKLALKTKDNTEVLNTVVLDLIQKRHEL